MYKFLLKNHVSCWFSPSYFLALLPAIGTAAHSRIIRKVLVLTFHFRTIPQPWFFVCQVLTVFAEFLHFSSFGNEAWTSLGLSAITLTSIHHLSLFLLLRIAILSESISTLRRVFPCPCTPSKTLLIDFAGLLTDLYPPICCYEIRSTFAGFPDSVFCKGSVPVVAQLRGFSNITRFRAPNNPNDFPFTHKEIFKTEKGYDSPACMSYVLRINLRPDQNLPFRELSGP